MIPVWFVLGFLAALGLLAVWHSVIPRALSVAIQVIGFIFGLIISVSFAIACAVIAYTLTH